jgi:hypothetical protein
VLASVQATIPPNTTSAKARLRTNSPFRITHL